MCFIKQMDLAGRGEYSEDSKHQTALAVIHTDTKRLISAEMSFLISTPYKKDQILSGHKPL